MFLLQPTEYGPVCERLLTSAPLSPLDAGKPVAAVRGQLETLNQDQLFANRSIVDVNMANCCRSALWLLFNYLHESHEISQEIETTSGSYWHGIMHRRETDFGNAKYWFRRVGSHPVFPQLSVSAREMVSKVAGNGEFVRLTEDWDPFRFVDLCERVQKGHLEQESLCRKIAEAEWQILFDYCYWAAIGK